MNDIPEYSTDALEVKADFYDKLFSVYVEGEEDIVFWESFFKISGHDSFHMEDVGGYNELIPHMNKIVYDDAKIIVAADLDHYELIGFDFSHDRIIRTYGYSIENTLYNTERIYKLIRKFSRGKSPKVEEINAWKIAFSNNAEQLLVLSIANSLYNRGIEIFGEKCNRFLKGPKSIDICETKIEEYKNSKSIFFSSEEITQAKRLLEVSTKGKWFLIKGHFLTNGVLNYIKYWVKAFKETDTSISLESLYAMCADLEDLTDHSDSEFHTVADKINKAVIATT